MTSSKNLAGLIGPTLVTLAVTEVLNFHIWAVNIPAITYFNGIVLFVVGLAIVRAHNRWVLGWPVLVTLVGWIGIAGGLFRTLAPEAQQAPDTPATRAVILGLSLVGAMLTFFAYRSGDAPSEDAHA